MAVQMGPANTVLARQPPADTLGELRHRAARISSELVLLSAQLTELQKTIGARRVPRVRTGESDSTATMTPDEPEAK